MEIGGATDHDTTREAYLFRAGETLCGVTTERAGRLLPEIAESWVFETSFDLGVNRVMPFRHDPEPILRGLQLRGFYVWDCGNVNNGEGTGT